MYSVTEWSEESPYASRVWWILKTDAEVRGGDGSCGGGVIYVDVPGTVHPRGRWRGVGVNGNRNRRCSDTHNKIRFYDLCKAYEREREREREKEILKIILDNFFLEDRSGFLYGLIFYLVNCLMVVGLKYNVNFNTVMINTICG